MFCQTYLCRFHQLKELQAYVEGIPESGLVIVCGDFNQNASEIKPQQVADKVALMRQTNQFVNVIPLIEQEYQALIRALGSPKYELVDLALEKYGRHPITFAESFTREDGQVVAEEPHLNNEEDKGTNQCLDYIFELRDKGT